MIKIQYEKVQKEYSENIKKLERDIIQCTDKIKLIEARRQTETQAFTTDIQNIKKRVINFERYIKRLKKHVDEEKTNELIAELENTEVAHLDMQALIKDIKALDDEVRDAKKFKLPY